MAAKKHVSAMIDEVHGKDRRRAERSRSVPQREAARRAKGRAL
jgi:hypothetical protein